jgi:hypothetical protein
MVVLLAGPEGGAAPSLMLEYQKSHRRRTALGPACAVGFDALGDISVASRSSHHRSER